MNLDEKKESFCIFTSISYQDLNFLASGVSGLTTRTLLLSADNDTPESTMKCIAQLTSTG